MYHFRKADVTLIDVFTSPRRHMAGQRMKIKKNLLVWRPYLALSISMDRPIFSTMYLQLMNRSFTVKHKRGGSLLSPFCLNFRISPTWFWRFARNSHQVCWKYWRTTTRPVNCICGISGSRVSTMMPQTRMSGRWLLPQTCIA